MSILLPIRPATSGFAISALSLGIVRNSPAAAASNSAILNTYLISIGATSPGTGCPIFFPGGDWYWAEDLINSGIFGTCVQTPAGIDGFSFEGGGMFRVANVDSVYTGPAVRHIYAGPSVSLASTTHTAVGRSLNLATSSTNSATGNTITFTSGWTVSNADIGATFKYTNDVFYRVVSVNTGTNSMTVEGHTTLIPSGTSTNIGGTLSYTLITITSGYTVKAQDKEAHVMVLSGTNVTLSGAVTPSLTACAFCVIGGVDTSANTWTLDRSIITSGTTTNLTGRMTYALWKEKGYGNIYSGMCFKGTSTVSADATSRPHIGLHVTGDLTTGGGFTGKEVFYDCSWSDFNVMVLAGKDLHKAYAKSANDDLWGEKNMNTHADHLAFHGCNAEHGYTFLYLRNRQSVSHRIRDQVHFTNITDSCVYVERGGEILVDSATVGGSRGWFLRVGLPNSGGGNMKLYNISYDASGSTEMRVYKRDQGNGSTTTPCRITVMGVHFDSPEGVEPMFDCYSADRLTVMFGEGLRPNSFRLTKGGDSPPYVPFVEVLNTVPDSAVTTPEDMFDESGSSTPYGTFRWKSITDSTGRITYTDDEIQDLV